MTPEPKITLTITDGGPDDLRDLRGWLVHEQELRGRVALVRVGPPPPGTLGPGLEALSVSIGSGGTLSVLVAGILSWIRLHSSQRHRTSTTAIELHRPDGVVVKIDVAGPWSLADVAAQARQLMQALDPGHPAPTEPSP